MIDGSRFAAGESLDQILCFNAVFRRHRFSPRVRHKFLPSSAFPVSKTVGIVDIDVEAVNQIGSQFFRLYGFGGKFRHRGNVADMSAVMFSFTGCRVDAVGDDDCLAAVIYAAELGFRQVNADPQRFGFGYGINRLSGGNGSAGLLNTGTDDAVCRRVYFGVFKLVLFITSGAFGRFDGGGRFVAGVGIGNAASFGRNFLLAQGQVGFKQRNRFPQLCFASFDFRQRLFVCPAIVFVVERGQQIAFLDPFAFFKNISFNVPGTRKLMSTWRMSTLP